MTKSMTLSELDAFLAVIALGTTQAAAKSLGLSQSAVSRRIAQLEAKLGLGLFVREQTRLVPTREARFLAPHARSLLDKGRWIMESAEEMAGGNASTMLLSLAFPGSLTAKIVPGMVAEFLAKNDRVRIEIHTGPYDTIERMVLDDRAQLGFVRLPVQNERLRVMPLAEFPTVCVMPRDHRLAAREWISLSDLTGEPMVLLGRQRAPRRELFNLFQKVGFRPRIRIEAHSVASACGLVAEGLGVAIVNELMARDYMHLGLTYRLMTEDLPHRFAFASLIDTPLTAGCQHFVDEFGLFLGRYARQE